MALISPGPGVGAISGNVGGVCFAVSRAGRHMRLAVRRCNQETESQLAHRCTVARAYLTWGALTAAQRLAWTRAAEQYPYKNRLHLQRTMPAWSLFSGLWLTKGSAFLGSFTNPPLMMAAPQPYSVTLTADLSSGFSLNWLPSTNSASYQITVFGARRMSGTLVEVPRSWRYLGAKTPGGQPWDIKSIFEAVFGTPAVGEVVFAKMRIWQLDRLPSAEVSVRAIVVA